MGPLQDPNAQADLSPQTTDMSQGPAILQSLLQAASQKAQAQKAAQMQQLMQALGGKTADSQPNQAAEAAKANSVQQDNVGGMIQDAINSQAGGVGNTGNAQPQLGPQAGNTDNTPNPFDPNAQAQGSNPSALDALLQQLQQKQQQSQQGQNSTAPLNTTQFSGPQVSSEQAVGQQAANNLPGNTPGAIPAQPKTDPVGAQLNNMSLQNTPLDQYLTKMILNQPTDYDAFRKQQIEKTFGSGASGVAKAMLLSLISGKAPIEDRIQKSYEMQKQQIQSALQLHGQQTQLQAVQMRLQMQDKLANLKNDTLQQHYENMDALNKEKAGVLEQLQNKQIDKTKADTLLADIKAREEAASQGLQGKYRNWAVTDALLKSQDPQQQAQGQMLLDQQQRESELEARSRASGTDTNKSVILNPNGSTQTNTNSRKVVPAANEPLTQPGANVPPGGLGPSPGQGAPQQNPLAGAQQNQLGQAQGQQQAVDDTGAPMQGQPQAQQQQQPNPIQQNQQTYSQSPLGQSDQSTITQPRTPPQTPDQGPGQQQLDGQFNQQFGPTAPGIKTGQPNVGITPTTISNPALNNAATVQKAQQNRMLAQPQPTTVQDSSHEVRPFDPHNWIDSSVVQMAKTGKPIGSLNAAAWQQVRERMAQLDIDPNNVTNSLIERSKIADTVLQHLDEIRNLIHSNQSSGNLGLAMTRWNDFLTNKVGGDDTYGQLFSQLMTNMDFIESAAAMAHGGQRAAGSPQMIAKWKGTLQAKTPETLESKIGVLEHWMEVYKNIIPNTQSIVQRAQTNAQNAQNVQNPSTQPPVLSGKDAADWMNKNFPSKK